MRSLIISTKSEFLEWKDHIVTREVMRGFHERIKQLEYELGQAAGLNSLDDRYKAGAIAAYSDILNVEHEDD